MSKKGYSEKYIYASAAFSALGGFIWGYDLAVIAGALIFITYEFNLTIAKQEIVVSLIHLGSVFGALFSGIFADYFGRKKLILFTAVVFIVGSLTLAFAPSYTVILIGRVIVGVAIGTVSMAVPLYIAEISPPNIRGTCVTLNFLAATVGFLIAYIIDDYLSYDKAWHLMLGMGAIPALILFVGMMFLPESPRWLIKVNKIDKAKEVLRKIRRECDILGEVEEIQESLPIQKRTFSEIFHPKARKAIYIGVFLAIFQQLIGIHAILYYLPALFKLLGVYREETAMFRILSLGVFFVLFTVLALILLDWIGRKKCLMASVIMDTTSLIVLGLLLSLPFMNEVIHFFIYLFMLIFIAGFALGLGPVTWLLICEIFPLNIRGIGMSLAIAALWAANFLVTLTFLSLIRAIGIPLTLWIYAVFGLINIFFICKFVPETKGMTLEQIEDLWFHDKKK